MLKKDNPNDQAVIAGLTAVIMARGPGEMRITVTYKVFVDKNTSKTYYSSDNGKTFVANARDPDGSRLDPVKDKTLIERLQPKSETTLKAIDYDIYRLDNDPTKEYYTKDGGKTFVANVLNPDNIAFDAGNPADAAAIVRLVPVFRKTGGRTVCDVYEDPTNGSKRYYTQDNGRTFFDDLSDPSGSTFAANDPSHAGVIANLVKVDSGVIFISYYNTYKDPNDNTEYFSSDGGKTFVSQPSSPQTSTLNPADPTTKALIDRLEPVCATSSAIVDVKAYKDPVTGFKYYEHPEKDGRYVNELGVVVLDAANPANLTVIRRLQEAQDERREILVKPYPEYDVYQYPPTGHYYYSSDGGQSFTSRPDRPDVGSYYLHDANVIANLQQVESYGKHVEYVKRISPGGGATISTQQAAQQALVTIDRAIVSKDKIRAHLGALQNRLENTVSNLSIQAENLQVAESRISDTDVATEMTKFVRSQILSQTGVAMLAQANSPPRMLASLIGG